MRIAVVYEHASRIGGTERYLENILAALARRGHQLGFLHEFPALPERMAERIAIPAETAVWCASDLGEAAALAELRQWRPDILFVHGLNDPSFEQPLLRLAPSVFLAHSYTGACISGTKTHRSPRPHPCTKPFGAGCLLQFYPKRCGGLNPVTMVVDYIRQRSRLRLLSSYEMIAVFSEHMRREYLALEIEPSRIATLPALAHLGTSQPAKSSGGDACSMRSGRSWRIMFAGRMEDLKGGQVLIDAMELLEGKLDREVRVVMAGEGPHRGRWEQRAREVEHRISNTRFDFRGWLTRPEIESLLGECDLAVVPSIWPEPFGLVGPEAGSLGVPVVAFDVGGIRQWLEDGVNGWLAPGRPPTAAGLAATIDRALSDPEQLRGAGAQASRLARRFGPAEHCEALERLFRRVL